MKNRTFTYWMVLWLMGVSLQGCMVWPVMTETLGYRPIEMGKRDQVFYPEAPRPTVLTSDFGNSQRAAIDNQKLNPEASQNLETVEGLDGAAGIKAMNRYRKFFDKPPFGTKSSGGSKKR